MWFTGFAAVSLAAALGGLGVRSALERVQALWRFLRYGKRDLAQAKQQEQHTQLQLQETREQLSDADQQNKRLSRRLERKNQQLQQAKQKLRQKVKRQRERLKDKDQQLERRGRRISRLQDQAKELENVRTQVSNQRKTLNLRSQEIEQLRKDLSVGGATVKGEIKGPQVEGSQDSGSLPDFLIIGTQKGGTTLLYYLLCQHPRIEPAAEKEVHYFDTPKFQKGEDWYRSNFPPPSSESGQKVITGEASPYYLFHPLTPKRAAHLLPNARLIALLRNPVDRAYSDYQNRLREGIEFLSFEEAIEAEEERIKGEKEQILSEEGYFSPNHRRYSYLTRGIYVDQLEDWHEHFQKDQLLVIKTEDFFSHPESSYNDVLKFLGIPEWKPEIISPSLRNEGKYAPMNPETRSKLEKYFEPHNQRLYEYLGSDFGW